jgi:hypothetical protein
MTTIDGYSAFRTNGKWIVWLPGGTVCFKTKAKAEAYIEHRYGPASALLDHGIGCYCHDLIELNRPRGF